MGQCVADKQRSQLWTDILGPTYFLACKNKKKNLKDAWCRARGTMPHQVTEENWMYYTNSTADCTCTVTVDTDGPIKYFAIPAGTENTPAVLKRSSIYKQAIKDLTLDDLFPKKEDQMNTDYAAQNEANTRRHLESRAYTAMSDAKQKLRYAFNLDTKSPMTLRDALDRIKASKYTIDTDGYASEDDALDTYNEFGAHFGLLSWRTPDQKVDRVAYAAAKEKVDAAYQNLLDDLKVLPPVDGLVALRAFQGTDFASPTVH